MQPPHLEGASLDSDSASAHRQLAVTVTARVLTAPLIGPALSWIGFRTAGLALHIPALRARMLTRGCGLSVTDAKKVVRSLTYGKSWHRFTAEQRRLVTAAHQLQKLLSEIRCPVVAVTAPRGRALHPSQRHRDGQPGARGEHHPDRCPTRRPGR